MKYKIGDKVRTIIPYVREQNSIPKIDYERVYREGGTITHIHPTFNHLYLINGWWFEYKELAFVERKNTKPEWL